MSVAAILFTSFFVLLLCNIPIAISLGLSSVLCILLKGLPMDIFPLNMYAGISKFLLLAIPFFVFAGNVMEKAGISDKLIRLGDAFVGHRRGGLAIVVVVTCCFFAAISGSGAATVAALGPVLLPSMAQAGYGKAMPSALLSSSGAIGIIIPPSVPFVVYGAISGVSITKMFMAGIIPGILMGIFLCLAAMRHVNNTPDLPLRPKASFQERMVALKDAIWGLLMPFIILGGIYGGLFTPTEAAVTACVYGLFVGLFIYKTLKFKDILPLLNEAAVGSANIMLIIACASLFAWFCSTSGISRMASNALLTFSGNQAVFLMAITVILLIAGCFLEATAALYIFVPIMLPVAIKLGYDPCALGVIMVVNMGIGLFTPPVGVNLYVACAISKINIKEITLAVLPYIVASLVALMLITYIPQLILILPQMLNL